MACQLSFKLYVTDRDCQCDGHPQHLTCQTMIGIQRRCMPSIYLRLKI